MKPPPSVLIGAKVRFKDYHGSVREGVLVRLSDDGLQGDILDKESGRLYPLDRLVARRPWPAAFAESN